MNTVQDNLMYCDLVSVNGIIHKVGVCGNSFRIIDAEGIPITPEILEKNGWKETEYWHEYQDGKNTIQCCLPDMRGRINGVEIENFKCEYVHQYQHLLRLCGLNELADNFKVQIYEKVQNNTNQRTTNAYC